MLSNLINQLEKRIEFHSYLHPETSKVSVGWHIEHSLITLEKISDLLSQSNPDDFRRQVNISREIAFGLGWLPRGRGKAPKVTLPKEKIDEQSLNEHLDQARQKIKELNQLHKSQFFTHPYFGDLNLKRSKRFLAIHTKHHLKIMDDIVRNASEVDLG